MNQNHSSLKGIENGRAQYAYQCVQSEGTKFGKEYHSLARKLPMLIKTNGLGTTLAFIRSKSDSKNNVDNACKNIYDQIGNWLSNHRSYLLENNTKQDLVEMVINLNSNSYRAVTKEVLALSVWLSRFASGLIEEQDKSEGQKDNLNE